MLEKLNLMDTPWKIMNQVDRWLYYPYIRLLFLYKGISWRTGWRIFGAPLVLKHRQSQMILGTGLSLRCTLRSNPLGANHRVILCTWQSGAKLTIGSNFAMTGGVICAAESITIGNRVTVGANTTIIDTDFHPLESSIRLVEPQSGKTSPVIIEDDVFIGMNCLILKGVHIGHDSVIGAGSVVTQQIPPGVIAAGNPARVIGPVDQIDKAR